MKSVPFVLTDARVVVGRVDAHYEETLVAESGESFAPNVLPVATSRGFDRAAAQAALLAVKVQSCARPNEVGSGHVTVTFLANGTVASAVVDSGPFQIGPAAQCLTSRFRNVRIAPYVGAPTPLGRSFSLTARPEWMPF